MADGAFSSDYVKAFRDLFDGQREFHAEGDGLCVLEPLNDRLFLDHLEGRKRLGVYCIAGRERDHCKWIVADVQGPDWELAAALARRLEKGYDLRTHIERSKTRGWHLWVFFASWVPCWKARAALRMAIADLKDRVIHPIELVPDQDQIPADPPDLRGRFVWLPMFGADVSQGRTCFHREVAGRPAVVEPWKPGDCMANREVALDHVLDGIDRNGHDTPYARGDDEAPEERRVEDLLPCANRMLKDGARGGAVTEQAKRLAIHLRRNGYDAKKIAAVLVPWNDRLCIPPITEDAVRTIITAAMDPENAKEGLGCDHPLILPVCARGECSVYRLAHNGAAPPPPNAPDKVKSLDGTLKSGRFDFVRGELFYNVANLDNMRGAMRCLLTCSRGNEVIWRQSVNLDSSRSRKEFEREVFARSKIADVAHDVMNIAVAIAQKIDEAGKTERDRDQKAKQGYVLTAAEVDATTAWAMARPRILFDMIEFTSQHGMIREFKNRILIFLLATSRKLDKPISGIGKGDSAGGKSYLASGIFKLLPEEDLVEYTRITGSALFYRDDEYSLQNKVFFVREAPGSEGSEHSLRTFMTEGDLVLSTVQKDESGKNVSADKRVKGPIAFYTTTTSIDINPENETRLMQVQADETKDTTCAIFKVESWKAQHGSTDATDDDLRPWRNFQRLLTKSADVFVPFAARLMDRFPSDNLRARRDFSRMLHLIKTCAFLHQFHRKRWPIVNKDGVSREQIMASVADYAIVKRVVEESLMRSALDIKTGQDELLNAMRQIGESALCEEKAGRPLIAHTEIHREGSETTIWIATPAIRQYLGKTQRSVRDLIRSLEEQGLVSAMPGRKSPIWVRLCDLAANGAMLLPTIDPETLFAEAPEERALYYDPLAAPDFDQIHKFDKE